MSDTTIEAVQQEIESIAAEKMLTASAAKDALARVVSRARSLGRIAIQHRGQLEQLAPAKQIATDLVDVLVLHAGETGLDENALETLKRIIAQRDEAQLELAQARTALHLTPPAASQAAPESPIASEAALTPSPAPSQGGTT